MTPAADHVIAVDGQLCMEGGQLVRHYLQQAKLHATFLTGGKNHATVVEDHVLTPADAAEALRGDLDDALAALESMR